MRKCVMEALPPAAGAFFGGLWLILPTHRQMRLRSGLVERKASAGHRQTSFGRRLPSSASGTSTLQGFDEAQAGFTPAMK